MLLLDEAKEALEQGEKRRALFEEEYAERRSALEAQAKELEKRTAGKKTLRAEQAKKTPADILKLYARWRKARNVSMIAKIIVFG